MSYSNTIKKIRQDELKEKVCRNDYQRAVWDLMKKKTKKSNENKEIFQASPMQKRTTRSSAKLAKNLFIFIIIKEQKKK